MAWTMNGVSLALYSTAVRSCSRVTSTHMDLVVKRNAAQSTATLRVPPRKPPNCSSRWARAYATAWSSGCLNIHGSSRSPLELCGRACR